MVHVVIGLRMEIVKYMHSLFFFFDIVCDFILFENEVYILINSVARFDDTMGTVHLSSFEASPSSCTCIVVETKGLCGACLTAQDRPSLWRWPWLRCSGLGKKDAMKEKALLWSLRTLCICMSSHIYISDAHLYCNISLEHLGCVALGQKKKADEMKNMSLHGC